MKAASHGRAAARLARKLATERTARSHRTTDLRRDMVELNVLRAFGAAVNDGLDRARILAAIKDHVPRLFRYDTLTVLLDGERPEAFVFPRSGVARELAWQAIAIVLDARRALRGEALRHRDVTIQIDHAPAVARPADELAPAADSHLTLPLVSGGEHLGFVSIASATRDAFGPLDLQLLSLISHQLSSAFRNANLLVQTRELAIRDGLTGLFNRRHFDERVEEEHRRAQRYGHPIALIIGDVDHFKAINDGYGHPIGDRVIKAVAAAIIDGTRSSDVLCRYGGEEFAVILPETTISEAVLVAERIRGLVSERGISPLEKPVHMSFGVAGSDPTGERLPLDGLIRNADGALYLAKQSGRNRVCVARSSGTSEASASAHEKRQHQRLGAKLPLRYLVVPDLGETAPVGRSVDISPTGLRVAVDHAVPEGAFILLELDDGKRDRAVRLLSKVVWSTPEADGTTMLGTRVVAVDGEARYHALLAKSAPERAASRAKRTTGKHPTAKRRKR